MEEKKSNHSSHNTPGSSGISISEDRLADSLTIDQAVEAAYSHEVAETASKLVRGLPVLIECDKELAPFMFKNVREPPQECQAYLHLPRRPASGEAVARRGADGTHGHHDRATAGRGARRGRTPRRGAAPSRLAHDQSGRAHQRGPRSYSSSLREPRAGLARIQGPIVPVAARLSRTCSRASSASSASRGTKLAPTRHPERKPQVWPRFLPLAALQVRLGPERGPSPQAALHPRRRGLPRRPETGLFASPAGDTHRRDGDSHHRPGKRHRRLHQGEGQAPEGNSRCVVAAGQGDRR